MRWIILQRLGLDNVQLVRAESLRIYSTTIENENLCISI